VLGVGAARYPEGGEQILVELDPDGVAGVPVVAGPGRIVAPGISA
jgi:hypothetical protein